MAELVLREYQERGVKIFRTLPRPARYFFAWDMGAGKTIGAISVARTYARNKCLVVCPAIVREVWAREMAKHWPGRTLGVITASRARNGLSKKKAAERDLAFAAEVQVVSYDLLGSVQAQGWDMIIVDEFHSLRAPGSKQSKLVRGLFRANPEAWGLGLSGTPIPNEAQQLWNPVDIFLPNIWGQTNRAGMVPYSFVNRYCHKEVNEYGTRFYGLREDRRADLAERFAKISMRVVQADFARYLPPLFVEALPVRTRTNLASVVKDWLAALGPEIEHVGIYTHLRETVDHIIAGIPASDATPIFAVTGATSSQRRDEILTAARKANRSIVVGTTHALKEGVSLSFQKAALIVEWVTEVAQVVQFIGRFARQDSTNQMPTRVQFVVGPNDVSRAEVLSERIDAIQSVVKSSRADEAAAGVFAAQEMTEEQYQADLQLLVANHERRAGLWSAEDDDDDTGE